MTHVAADVKRLTLIGMRDRDSDGAMQLKLMGSTAAPAVVRRALAPNTSAEERTKWFAEA